MRLLLMEMRRDLARRMVRVLVLLALAGCAVVAIAAFASAKTIEEDPPGPAFADCTFRQTPTGEFVQVCQEVTSSVTSNTDDVRILVNLWRDEANEGSLLVSAPLLIMGGLLAGASMIGGEWRSGNMTTTLTWEPRRVRLLAAKLAAGAILAFVIAMALQAVFAAAFLPTVFVKGSTEGADAAWWADFLGATVRVGLITSFAATVGGALAVMSRNTGGAVGALFAWVSVGENIIRGIWPERQRWLVTNNIGRFVQASASDFDSMFGSHVSSALVLLGYLGLVGLVAFLAFTRRDVAATT